MYTRARIWSLARICELLRARMGLRARDVSFNELKRKSASFLASAGLPLALALSSANNKKCFFKNTI